MSIMKLIMCKGLPGSGKSTWAKEVVASDPSFIRVNKDEIRIELGIDRSNFSREKEYAVVDRRDYLIREALASGKSVISDDTNFGRKHEPRLRELAKAAGAEFEIKDFTDVPVQTCIDRDARRDGDARVGEKVILGMAEANGIKIEEPVEKVEVDYSLPYCIICDLDGTLALKHEGRNIYDASTADLDHINDPVRATLLALEPMYSLIFMSGREDKYREPSVKFLDNCGWSSYPLYMRATGDFRKDSIVKRELFDAHIRGKYNVLFVLDDRDQVVKMWRELGLTCFQVAEGSF